MYPGGSRRGFGTSSSHPPGPAKCLTVIWAVSALASNLSIGWLRSENWSSRLQPCMVSNGFPEALYLMISQPNSGCAPNLFLSFPISLLILSGPKGQFHDFWQCSGNRTGVSYNCMQGWLNQPCILSLLSPFPSVLYLLSPSPSLLFLPFLLLTFLWDLELWFKDSEEKCGIHLTHVFLLASLGDIS